VPAFFEKEAIETIRAWGSVRFHILDNVRNFFLTKRETEGGQIFRLMENCRNIKRSSSRDAYPLSVFIYLTMSEISSSLKGTQREDRSSD
jgi:hypothetical protein